MANSLLKLEWRQKLPWLSRDRKGPGTDGLVSGNSGTINLTTSSAPKWPFSRSAAGTNGPLSLASATQAWAGIIPLRKIAATTSRVNATAPPGLCPFR